MEGTRHQVLGGNFENQSTRRQDEAKGGNTRMCVKVEHHRGQISRVCKESMRLIRTTATCLAETQSARSLDGDMTAVVSETCVDESSNDQAIPVTGRRVGGFVWSGLSIK